MAPHSEYCLIVQPLLFLLFLFSCLQQRPQAAGSYILQRVCGHYHPGSLSSFKVCTFDTVHHSMTDTKWYVQACHGTRPPPSQDLKHSPASPSAHRPSRVTLTWSSGYFGGCVCCPRPSTFHCGCTLQSPSKAPPKPSSPHPPALRPSQVTLTWSSGYIGGCVCCSTFRCGCSLCNPSYKDTPSVRLFSPSHFCFQFFITDVPSPHTPPFMGLA